MKPSKLTFIIAFLLGISIFGLYKSLELLKKNISLTSSIGELDKELTVVSASLKETKDSLGESQQRNARLEDDINSLGVNLSNTEKEVQKQQRNASILFEKLNEATDANDALVARNEEMEDAFIRMSFENSELKKKFSSVSELKKAIRELKVAAAKAKKGRLAEKQKKQVPRSAKAKAKVKTKDASEAQSPGNRGFVVKDGQSTFQGIVNIEVLPVESGM